MDFKAEQITIQSFFTDKQYRIPRYQRNYSWTKDQLNDFYYDIVSNIKVDGDKYEVQDYFFGTVILVGDMGRPGVVMEIVDGQQRITTITIFLCVLSKKLYEHGDKQSSKCLWKYIMSEDNDGKSHKVLDNETANHYFAMKVQTRPLEINEDGANNYQITNQEEIEKEEKNLLPNEKYIKAAYEFFEKKLSDDNLSAPVFKDSKLSKLKKLKAVRDQLLNSFFVYICSKNASDVNVIFENINSKGLQLTTIDLIKNKIFSVLSIVEPLDEAQKLWAEINDNLNNEAENVAIEKFYRYFWLSRYTDCTEKELYKEFVNTINCEDYGKFLIELRDASKIYSEIVFPKKEYFMKSPSGENVNKDEVESFVHSLNVLQNTLCIEQVRVLLITLLDKYHNGQIGFKSLKSMVFFLEEFHFIYNGILKQKPSTYGNRYRTAAKEIYKADKNKIGQIFQNLKNYLKNFVLDSEEEFVEGFTKLEFSTKNKSGNVNSENKITKYAIYKLEEKLSNENKTCFDTISATIEHIVPESKEEIGNSRLNVGNLMILEKSINQGCANKELKEKYELYRTSHYHSVEQFIKKYARQDNWNIEDRAKNMAEDLYDLIVRGWK